MKAFDRNLVARVDGIVLSRNFKEGDDVTAGMTLYQIDPASYELGGGWAERTAEPLNREPDTSS